jgi:hypothetical protein
MKSGILDTRDLAKELRDLEDERDTLEDAIAEAEGEEKEEAEQEMREWEEENGERLEELMTASESVGGEWGDGVSLIPEDEFEDYCRELLADIGDLPKDIPWYIEIDWTATADNLRQDYSSVTISGVDYLYR